MMSTLKRLPTLRDADSRQRILREIMKRQGIVGKVGSEYITWRIPWSSGIEERGRKGHVNLDLLALCSPGASIFENGTGCSIPPASDNHLLRRFTSTSETRCVRDIKRFFSWKIYGIRYDITKDSYVRAHYVRVSFANRESDEMFSKMATLLDGISAKRHIALPNIRPFGIGVDDGVPETHDRIYLINDCAKLTPYLRKVMVHFEVNIEGIWQRFDTPVDRIGFATYRAVPKKLVKSSSSPEEIHFVDDPYVRFGRVTLRFGDSKERAYIDLEGVEDQAPHVSRTRKGTVVYLPKVRVRTGNGHSSTAGRTPVHTMVRLVFREKDLGILSHAKVAVKEAEKFATLVQKASDMVTARYLGIRNCIEDKDIVPIPIAAVSSMKNYSIKFPGEMQPHRADISDKFSKAVQMFAVPTHRTSSRGGIALITQSLDGQFVIRQHIENPIEFIASISDSGFTLSHPSTLITTKTGARVPARGGLCYCFSPDERNATIVVDKLIKLVISIDAQQALPSRLPLLKALVEQRDRPRYAIVAGHSRAASDASGCSDVSDASVESIESLCDAKTWSQHKRQPSDWDIFEGLKTEEIFQDKEDMSLEIEIQLDIALEQLQREHTEYLEKQRQQQPTAA
ncbi:hypothetical protein EX30DRAFT_395698 [Ascodesmis nigricans]|uniref:Uncharacterized protein n=1 Tax=Ascodesmis nigricans TaxID=341454 RepID=A0A4S2MWY8_9PEZI|nr:hypothetical protein EX30DRAFT_395698 [Ascodesmis nigricans]